MDSTNKAEFPEGEGRPQHRCFDLGCMDNTPQMWMDHLERMRASSTDPDADLNPPLRDAAASGRADIVQFMLDKGYNKDVLDDEGRTPLHQAAGAEADSASVAVVQVLLAAGASVGLRCHGGKSPLDRAAEMGHVDIARELLRHGAGVNAAPADGFTPLHSAALHDRPDMVSLLCFNGADVDKLNADGYTPLKGAAIVGTVAAVRALLAGGADATLRNGGNALSALDTAVKSEQVGVLVAMIEHGVDVNDSDGLGFTALHHAAMYDDMAAATEVLIGADADIEARMDGNRCTPLFVAAKKSNVSTVAILLKHGASINARSATEQTPLYHAAASAGRVGAAEVVDLLLRHGADEKAVDSDGQTPADVIGLDSEEEDRMAEDVERVRQLLANAPADRAWRRRGFLVLCRAHYPSGRVQLGHRSSHAHDIGVANRTHSRAGPSRADMEWAGVASMLMGVGADPISLMGDGADLIFQTIVGYL